MLFKFKPEVETDVCFPAVGITFRRAVLIPFGSYKHSFSLVFTVRAFRTRKESGLLVVKYSTIVTLLVLSKIKRFHVSPRIASLKRPNQHRVHITNLITILVSIFVSIQYPV